MQSGSSGILDARRIGFTVTIPLRFNPAPGEKEGKPVPPEQVAGVARRLHTRFPFSRSGNQGRLAGYRRSLIIVQDGIGESRYETDSGDLATFQEPERYFTVDIALPEAAVAWDWFARQCPRWAEEFEQYEIYLRVLTPQGLLTYTFAPPNAAWRLQYTNPF